MSNVPPGKVAKVQKAITALKDYADAHGHEFVPWVGAFNSALPHGTQHAEQNLYRYLKAHYGAESGESSNIGVWRRDGPVRIVAIGSNRYG